ncbi:MAG: toxin-antitoxin system protein, partial [Clostridiales bacterium]
MSPVTSPLKERVSITLDSDVVNKITQYARMDGRNFSQYINFVLMRHI